MYKVIVPKYALKELSKIDKENQQLIFNKIKDLENGIFDNDKSFSFLSYTGKCILKVVITIEV